MPEVLDRPVAPVADISEAPKWFADALEEVELYNDLGFPNSGFVISLGGGKHAMLNITPVPIVEENYTINALCYFENEEQIDLWNAIYHMEGENVPVKFEEAVELAKGKINVSAVALEQDGRTTQVFYVR